MLGLGKVLLVDWDEKMEQEWMAVFAHESGHAMMALLKGVPCYGIYFEKRPWEVLRVFANPSDKWRHEDYVVSAAGVAAELLVYQIKTVMGLRQTAQILPHQMHRYLTRQ